MYRKKFKECSNEVQGLLIQLQVALHIQEPFARAVQITINDVQGESPPTVDVRMISR